MASFAPESAPALRSLRTPLAIMNQWLHLGEVHWLTRIEGFSMYAETEFGAFYPAADAAGAGSWLEDPSVGLKLRSGALRDCRVLGVPEIGEIQFCLSMENNSDIFVSQASRNKNICPVVQRIEQIFGFDGSTQPAPWMDEWPTRPEACRNCPFSCFETAERISHWKNITIEVETGDLSLRTTLCPTSADRDDSVLRIFDSRNRLAIYLDLTLPDLSIFDRGDNSGCLRLGSPALN